MDKEIKVIVLTETGDRHAWWGKYVRPYAEEKKLKIDSETFPDGNLSFLSLDTVALFCKLTVGYLLRYRHYDIIVTFQHYLSTICVGILNSLVNGGAQKHIVLQFNRMDGDHSIGSRFKDYLLRLSLKSTTRIVCHSKRQVISYSKLFAIPEERFKYIPLCIDQKLLQFKSEKGNEYILSAGKTFRDYGVLIKAVEDIGVKVIIIADNRSVEGLTIPPLVTLLTNVPYWDYIQLMAKSQFVVVPLQDREMSTGQSVIQAAMALGKAVIATRTSGTVDYIIDNVSGILIEPSNHEMLRTNILRLLHDSEETAMLGTKARKCIEENYTIQKYLESLVPDFIRPGRA